MLRHALVSTCLVLGLTSLSFGQVKLERKVRNETSHTAETYSRIDQVLTIVGMDMETNVESRTTVKSTAGKRDEAGLIQVKEKIESLQVTINNQAGNYFFDSANPDNKGTSDTEAVRDIHKALMRRVSTTTYDKQNKIVSIQSENDVLSTLPVELQNLVKSQLDPENLKKAANEQLDQLPSEPVSKGDSWQRTSNASFGAGQFMEFQTKLTYEGTVEKDGRKLEKITAKALSVNYYLKDSPLQLVVKSNNLKATETDSVILFDRELGQVVETKSSTHIAGDIVFEVNGMELPSKLDLKMQYSVLVK